MKRRLIDTAAAEDDARPSKEAPEAASPVCPPVKSSIRRTAKRRRRPKGQSRTVQIMEDYVAFVGRMVYPLLRSEAALDSGVHSPYLSERITPLGIVTLPMRRKLCIEHWTPYEIAKFEGSMCVHGKNFHAVQRDVQTKCTKDIIEFYYLWKKTSHYKLWKRSYEPEELIYANDSDADRPKAS